MQITINNKRKDIQTTFNFYLFLSKIQFRKNIERLSVFEKLDLRKYTQKYKYHTSVKHKL